MAATLDVITEGRVVLGLGAGFRQIEADTFGFPYPSLGERLAMLGEHFEIVTRALNHDEPPFSFERPLRAGSRTWTTRRGACAGRG